MNLFPNALHVARREYLMRVRSRAFVIVTAGMVIVGLLLAMAPVIFQAIAGDKPKTVAVSVPADLPSAEAFVTQLEQALNGSQASDQADAPRFHLSLTDDSDASRRQVKDGDLSGLLEVSRTGSGDLQYDYISNDSIADASVAAIRQAASGLAISDRLDRAGVAASDKGAIFAPVAFDLTSPDPNAVARSGGEFGGRYAIAFFFVLLNFIAIMNYGNWVAGSVAEEKSSRVMELLITAATPRQLLLGKLLGTCAAALTQYGALIVALIVGFLVQGRVAQALLGTSGVDLALPGLTVPFVIVSLLFFIGGFVLYSTLYAAAGSMVSRQEDVQQAGAPLMMVAMAGYFASFVALNTPDSAWVQVVSYVPFASPYMVAIRAAFGSIAPWEVPIIAVALLVTIAGAVWLAARIYSAGVLLYGQRLGIREVLRAARVSR
ncbi:MAG TPA: ABC transporter permease [Candidatus Limnocylindria bacterium]|nr:ABC transporter permease [Candidatus Limnocylindria bacterium]